LTFIRVVVGIFDAPRGATSYRFRYSSCFSSSSDGCGRRQQPQTHREDENEAEAELLMEDEVGDDIAMADNRGIQYTKLGIHSAYCMCRRW